MRNIEFIKMHGIGNDFVVIDARTKDYDFSKDMLRYLCDRHIGIGCDQLVVIKKSSEADCFVEFYNSDGTSSGACGNASRCVAKLMIDELHKDKVVLQTLSGLLVCNKRGELIAVNMGKPKLNWQDIPLSGSYNTLKLEIGIDGLPDAVAVNVGNPHAIFFVADVENIDVNKYGMMYENHKIFPQRANISFAQIISKNNINLRVWERGVGITLACGTAACATVVAAGRLNFIDNDVTVNLPGGKLNIILEKDNVIMTGPASISFKGVLQ